jgi:hypothetical protein
MTAKDYQDRGTINRIDRKQHPPHRNSGFTKTEKGLTWGNEMSKDPLLGNISQHIYSLVVEKARKG